VFLPAIREVTLLLETREETRNLIADLGEMDWFLPRGQPNPVSAVGINVVLHAATFFTASATTSARVAGFGGTRLISGSFASSIAANENASVK
jgi:hypothetical protein